MSTDPLSAARMQALAAAPSGQPSGGIQGPSARANIEAASRDFEAMFLAQMLQPMFAELPTDGPFGGGPGEAAFRDLLVTEYAREMSKHTRLGVAEAMTRTLLAAQEGAAPPGPGTGAEAAPTLAQPEAGPAAAPDAGARTGAAADQPPPDPAKRSPS